MAISNVKSSKCEIKFDGRIKNVTEWCSCWIETKKLDKIRNLDSQNCSTQVLLIQKNNCVMFCISHIKIVLSALLTKHAYPMKWNYRRWSIILFCFAVVNNVLINYLIKLSITGETEHHLNSTNSSKRWYRK